MSHPIRSLALTLLLVLVGPGCLADPFRIDSERADLFIGPGPTQGTSELPMAISLNAPSPLRGLREHCQAKRPLYDQSTGRALRCQIQPVQDPALEGTDQWDGLFRTFGPGATPLPEVLILGLRPPPAQRWTQRAATKAEAAQLRAAWASLPAPRRRPLNWSGLRIHQAGTASPSLWVLPQRPPQEPETEHPHHVFAQQGGGALSYLGELSAKPARLAAQHDSPWPLILIDENCDGWCLTLHDTSRALHRLASLHGGG